VPAATACMVHWLLCMLPRVNIWLWQSIGRKYADQRRREVEFAVDEQVLLNTRDIRLQAPYGGTPKLMPRWIGPFPMVEKVGSVAYRLNLPDNLKMHSVFHVLLLKAYHSSDRRQPRPGQCWLKQRHAHISGPGTLSVPRLALQELKH
jgi:hypothetical protein